MYSAVCWYILARVQKIASLFCVIILSKVLFHPFIHDDDSSQITGNVDGRATHIENAIDAENDADSGKWHTDAR